MLFIPQYVLALCFTELCCSKEAFKKSHHIRGHIVQYFTSKHDSTEFCLL